MSILVHLRFVLTSEADREAFERDLEAMRRVAEGQPGFRWGEVGRDPRNDRTYIVVSEWDEIDHVRAYEHHPQHEAIMHRWEERYAETFQHRRFVPWIRPADAEAAS